MHVCMYARMYVCTYVCMYVRTHTYAHTHITHIHIHDTFLRAMRDGQSAPEDLQEITAPPPREERKARREEFSDSAWISLSVGRKQNAEPRWLLPMLCGAGNITKTDIGAIKVQTEETYVQLDAACVDRFMAAIGPNKTLEKNIRVTKLDTPPNVAREVGRAPAAGKPQIGRASCRERV